MLVSILVPIYGVEKYIERCVVSLLEQDYKDIEYVFVNDYTKDKSMDVLRSVLKRYPNRIPCVKIINHDLNKGLASTRNTAIVNALGNYVFIVDSDDWISKNTISESVNLAILEDADIVNVGINVHYENRVVHRINSFHSKEENLSAVLDKSVYCNIWGRLIKRSLFFNYGIRCIDGANMGEDFCQVTKLMYFANKISYINKPLYNYNCVNCNGYTINYSYDHTVQVWTNYEDVCDFFKSKEEIYRRKLNICFLKLICDHLRISKSSKDGERIFTEERLKLTDDKLKFKRDLNFTDKVLISLSASRNAVNTFLSFLSFIKRIKNE